MSRRLALLLALLLAPLAALTSAARAVAARNLLLVKGVVESYGAAPDGEQR